MNETIFDIEWSEGISDKEKKFILEYAKDSDKDRALIVAGYSDSVQSWMGDKLLSRPEIRQELAMVREHVGPAKDDIPIEEIIAGFRSITDVSMTDFFDFNGEVMDISEMDPVKAKAIKEIKKTVNPRNGHITTVVTLHDKIAALQNLGRIGGHYAADNGQNQGDVNIQVVLPGGLNKL